MLQCPMVPQDAPLVGRTLGSGTAQHPETFYPTIGLRQIDDAEHAFSLSETIER